MKLEDLNIQKIDLSNPFLSCYYIHFELFCVIKARGYSKVTKELYLWNFNS